MAKAFKRFDHQPDGRLLLTVLLTTGFLSVVAAAAPTAAPTATAAAAPAATTDGRSGVEQSGPSLFAPDAGTKTAVAAQAIQAAKDRFASEKPSEKDSYAMRLDVDRQSGEDWEAAYDRYLSAQRVHPKLVRAKVRRLVGGSQPDLEQVIGLLRAALRTGQMQAWMYEALALTMQMNNMPQADIERVLLSSADFATTPQQLIFLADYMDRLGHHQRALELLHEVSLRAAGLPVTYAKALDLATYLKDDQAIRWAALGVLRQEWPQEKSEIFQKARRSAEALVERLRAEQKDDEANRFAMELKDALRRDVVVKVSWSGDADVDLMVQEPTGSVCSYRQNRTSGGGVLVGDPHGNLERSAGDGYAEVYCCPEAFSGDYRVMLRQVWGRIPAGRVTVDVWNHLGSDKTTHFHQIIPLDENGALVSFSLDEGRRQESLADEQVTNDVINQVSVNRAILAQQLGAISDPQVILGQQTSGTSQRPPMIGNRPVFANTPRIFNPTAVGYQPVITTLPVGMTLQTNAVISADRRYVRITSVPFFSLIKGVVQYNIQTGVTSQEQSDQAFVDLDLGIPAVDGAGGDAAQGQVLLVTIVAGKGVVTRTGPTTAAIAVSLTATAGLIGIPAPPAVTIAAGDASVVFPAGAATISGSGTLTANATGYLSGSYTIPPP